MFEPVVHNMPKDKSKELIDKLQVNLNNAAFYIDELNKIGVEICKHNDISSILNLNYTIYRRNKINSSTQ